MQIYILNRMVFRQVDPQRASPWKGIWTKHMRKRQEVAIHMSLQRTWMLESSATVFTTETLWRALSSIWRFLLSPSPLSFLIQQDFLHLFPIVPIVSNTIEAFGGYAILDLDSRCCRRLLSPLLSRNFVFWVIILPLSLPLLVDLVQVGLVGLVVPIVGLVKVLLNSTLLGKSVI